VFNSFAAPPVDAILALSQAFRADQRPGKTDLGIGVYKDSAGATPVMRAVKAAEKRVWQSEGSKAYLGLGGDETFAQAIDDLVLGAAVDRARVRSIQTVGGGAAVRLICDMLVEGGAKTIWVPSPTWLNHIPIARSAGLVVREYAYLDHVTSAIAFERMLQDLAQAEAGDVVLIHGCCHNPSGVDLEATQWTELASLLSKRGLLPFIDIAYQGFGDGLDQDAAGLRHIAAQLPEVAIATSCSKNFGVYRDRVGTAILLGQDAAGADRAKAVLLAKGRVNYSFPPNHGAATVATILNDPTLAADWREELESMRKRMVGTRAVFATALRQATNSDRFDFVSRQKGMFSLIGLEPAALQKLQSEHAIFMPPDGRMNVAALRETDVERVAAAIAAVA
jgi:aspartate/tyrosine/aromatic aminotransferase